MTHSADESDFDSAWLASYLQVEGSALATQSTHPSALSSAPLQLQRRIERARRWMQALDGCWDGGSTADLPAVDPSLPEFDSATSKRLGKFEIVRLLGSGGSGLVFLARDPHLKRQVALKIPRPDYVLNVRRRERFLREARAIASLQHPYLATVFEAGELGPICFIASEFCSGPTLAEWLAERTESVLPRVAALLTSLICEVVSHIHQHGILHRDIKPSNILLQPLTSNVAGGSLQAAQSIGYLPRLTDFGLARLLHSETGNIDADVGTPSYMAPEQALGHNDSIGVTTDVYGIGALLYHLLTGQPPFRGENDAATRQLVAEQRLVSPRFLRPDLPRELEAICLKCLASTPSARYSSAEQVREELQRYLQGKPIAALRYYRIQRFAKSYRRHPLVATLLTALFITLMTASLGMWRLYSKAELHRRQAETNFRQALAAVDNFSQIANSAIGDIPGVELLRRQLDETSLEYYEAFIREQGDGNPQLRRSLARAYFRVGQIHIGAGESEAAYLAYEKAVGLQEEVLSQATNDTVLVGELATSLFSLSSLAFERGNETAGLELQQRSLKLRTLRLDGSPNDEVQLCGVAGCYNRIGLYYIGRRDRESALEQLQQAEQLWERVLGQSPKNVEAKLGLAVTLNRTAMAWGFDQQRTQAIQLDQEAATILESLVAEYPLVNGFHRELASCCANLARWQARIDRPAAEANHRKAIAIRESLVAINPGIVSYQDDLSESLWIFGEYLARRRRYPEAMSQLERAQSMLANLQQAMPDHIKYQRRLDECNAALDETRKATTGRLRSEIGDRQVTPEQCESRCRIFKVSQLSLQ
jgi:serine/threonine protein kinase